MSDAHRRTGRTAGLVHSPIGAAFDLLAAHTPNRPLLNLSQAAPSFAPAPVVAEHIATIAHSPDGGRYVPQQGLESLRVALAAELTTDYPGSVHASEVLITAGCNQAFCVVASAVTSPGDNVIVAVPYYFNHDMWLEVEGVTCKHLSPTDDMTPSASHAATLIDKRTRAIVLVSPGNPSGAIIDSATLRSFFDLAVSNDLVLIIDETYRSFRDTDQPAHDLYDQPGWQDNLITLHSFSKDLAIPGYRVGAAVGHPDLLAQAMKLVDCVAICAPRIGQEAALAGLLHAGDWRAEQVDRINQLHTTFTQMMSANPGGFELVSSGAYFGWVRHPYPNHATLDVVSALLTTSDILVIPGTAFTPTDENMLRFSFANLDPDEIAELGRRLATFAL